MVVALLLALVACGGPAPDAPAELQVNGYVVERDSSGNPTGRVEVGVSAFDSAGNIVTDAQIRGVSASVTEVTTSSGGVQFSQSYTVTGGVCGNIVGATGPLAAVLMIDESGSMLTYDGNLDRHVAGERFVAELRGNDVASVARFPASGGVTSGLKNSQVMATFTSGKTTLVDAINTAPFAYGGFTPLWDAAHDSVTLLSSRTETNKVAVVLTDGLNNSGSETASSANQFARDEGVKVYGLGFGTASASQLDALVTGTGGYRDLIDANDPDTSIANLLDNIFAATQAQGCVNLTFAPTPTAGVRIKGSVTVQFDDSNVSDDFDIRF